MNIVQAKEQVKYAVAAYLARDDNGRCKIALSRQRPVLLMGAPGIGKTAIMEQIASELGCGIVSYSMTHHTRQSALGLPFIVHRQFEGVSYDASEYTMSEIIASIYELMERSGVREGILFLDEINCVSETLTPSMLQFLQYKTFGRHKVPEGWVIVCAGNPPEYNRSVHEFDIVTLDRVKKIEVEPDFEVWKSYAHGVGVHESIMSFLLSKPECFYRVERTLSGKEFVTARSWVDLSEMIKLHEEMGFPVDVTLVGQYVQQPDIAEEFALYYELYNRYRSSYGVEGILAGKADEQTLQSAREAELDERLSLISLLLGAAGSTLREAMEREENLLHLRDMLRALKERVARGEDMHVLLDEARKGQEEELERDELAGALGPDRERVLRYAIDRLRGYLTLVNESASAGAAAFEMVQQAYLREVEEMQALCERGKAELSHMFSFVEEAFGEGQEMVVLVTELTARPQCARFIAEFGCDEYFEHNSDLLVFQREKDLRKRIGELGLS